MPAFIHGLDLGRRFYHEAVRPILDEHFPGLAHTAALIGYGSEILGFDDETSTDHCWGPRVLLFLRETDIHVAPEMDGTLARDLPLAFAGYPVGTDGCDVEAPARHRVPIHTLRAFILGRLAYDVDQPLDPADWLTFPSQRLLEIMRGAVYHDGTGELAALRERLAYYPHDVWLYLLAAGWRRIGQEEHLMLRAGFVGDELGSALIGSRLVRDVMNLCFLMERQYAPYAKWFGTAFTQLACAGDLSPVLRRAQCAGSWREREAALCEAYEYLARMHNALRITEEWPVAVSRFYTRPFKVIHGDVFAQAILSQITDPEVKLIASQPLIGSIDQYTDSTDLRWPHFRHSLRRLYV